jgi:hypothetical protein
MSITVNGQLLLVMLSEWIYEYGVELCQLNTDGILIYCPKDKIDGVRKLCDKWEELTQLSLDFDYFDKIVQRDVNNYIGKYDMEKMGIEDEQKAYKYKGSFEIDKDYHKDHSMRIVPIAISNYFFNDIKPEDTINNHKDIYDFCILSKMTKGWHLENRRITDNGDYVIEKLQKTNRYFISNKGGTLMKCHEDGRENNLHVGTKVTIFNNVYDVKEFNDYNVNYNFYISKAWKEINNITKNFQTTLF